MAYTRSASFNYKNISGEQPLSIVSCPHCNYTQYVDGEVVIGDCVMCVNCKDYFFIGVSYFTTPTASDNQHD